MSPHDTVIVEIAWCPGCRADCTVEIVSLAGDPGPVAVCVDCGLGLELCWPPALPTSGLAGPARAVVAKAS